VDASLADAKRELRTASRERRRALTPAERARASARAVARLVTLPELETARTVALYGALPDEADPSPLVDVLHARGVTVLLPRVTGDELELVGFTTIEGLSRGYRGVSEPVGPATANAEVDLIVVPGLAFDLGGGRLGQGGGHYDRLLALLPVAALRVGLCLQCQVVAEVPTDDHDARMDVVVTETGVWRTDARAA